MVSTAIFLHLRPHRHRQFLNQTTTSYLRSYSSSNNSDDNNQNRPQFSFNDVKASLKQTPTSPQHTRRPSLFNSSSINRENTNQKAPSLEEIRKNLSEFRRRSAVEPPKSSAPVVSFQEIYKRNVTPKAESGSGSVKTEADHMQSIRNSLKNISPKLSQLKQLTDDSRKQSLGDIGLSLKPRPKSLNRNNNEGIVSNETRADFVRTYSAGEMGKRLRKLRPGDKKVKFSLTELNERLQKFREMEEKEAPIIGGLVYESLREGLVKLKGLEDEKEKKKNAGIRVLSSFDTTARFEKLPPNESLVEKYFHPDHMSSAEKQKLELKNVREKFKISESDCGSARVQVAQLTTKIKHLATVLHKKDKHSRKGLQAMVQKRKKLLKYLRRTDWDSYCYCLSELGLRDSADYKA
ncbi:hypothetical protein QVD17_25546 [Tagetes erecta]|uniref:Small ribosomal subunit protein uS15c n=1 Tax=Tagetes erecta TaxID=13708 RepID=A0AAD8NVG3_TARER|nr:hypothetical protein QVD17_25546 [Tagetes erecta]